MRRCCAWRARRGTGAVVAAVGDQLARRGQDGGEHVGALLVVHLPRGEHHDDGAAVAVAYGVELRVQPAPGAGDAARTSSFLRKLAAARCALRCVASIISRDGDPASAAGAGLAAAMQRLARSAWRSNCSAPVSSAPALWPAGGRADCQGGLPHQRAALRHPPRLSGLGRSPLQLLRRPDAATPRRKPSATAGASWGKARHPGRGPARRHPLRSRPLALDRRRPPQGLGTSARTTAFAAPPSASCA